MVSSLIHPAVEPEDVECRPVILVDERAYEQRRGCQDLTHADAGGVRVERLPKSRFEIVWVEPKGQISLLVFAPPVLDLDARARGELELGEDLIDVLLEVVVGPEPVRLVVQLANADGETVPDPRDYHLVAVGAVPAYQAIAEHVDTVSGEQRVPLTEARVGRTGSSEDERVVQPELRLDG